MLALTVSSLLITVVVVTLANIYDKYNLNKLKAELEKMPNG